MGLSNELIYQFVDITNDAPEPSKESTMYGTTVEFNGRIYVRLDGSPEGVLTPVTTTTALKPDERVTVMVKNHSAVVTGNITTPSARTDDVKEMGSKISEFEIIVAYRVTADDINAITATIESLKAKTAHIDNIEAVTAEIEKLEAKYASLESVSAKDVEALNADIENLRATFGEFTDLSTEELEAINADINNLRAYNADFTYVSAEVLSAIKADIKTLNVDKLSAAEADIKYATIENLKATNADVENLDANVGKIDTLIFGVASGNTIQTNFANAVIAQLGNAQIKSAMIDSVSASKIAAGTISTNNVQVQSDDGKLLISDETIQISDDSRVRVQIGKDAAGDYSLNIWDASGNLMFSQGGITDKAIKTAIIRDDMVSETANISASKLDINSLFEEINGSEKTIKSTKIYLDDKKQTLDVAFTEMTSKVNEMGETVSSQGTAISTIQGQISSKIWQSDITIAVDNLSIGGRNYFRPSLVVDLGCTGWSTAEYKLISTGACIGFYLPTAPGEVWSISRDALTNNRFDYCFTVDEPANNSPIIGWTDKYRNDFKMEGIVVPEGCNYLFVYLSNAAHTDVLPNVKIEKGNKATDWTPAPEDTEDSIKTLSDRYTSLDQTVDSITATVAEHTTQISKKADGTAVESVSKKVTEIEADIEGFKTTVANTYTTNETHEALQSRVKQTETDISSVVSRTNKVEGKFAEYPTTTQMNSAINQKADSIVSTVTTSVLSSNRNYFRPSLVVDLGCTGMASGEQSLIATGSCIGFYVSTTPGEVWSVSRNDLTNNRFDYCFTVDEPLNGSSIIGWNSGYRDSLKMEGLVVPEGCNYLFLYLSNESETDILPNIKLEKGEKATYWTPAPEDDEEVANNISSANDSINKNYSEISQLKDAISNLVVGDDTGNIVVQKPDGTIQLNISNILSDIRDAEGNLSTHAESIKSIIENAETLDQALELLKTAVGDLNGKTEYIKQGSYENEPCLELGKLDSEFKVIITNTRMLFLDGTNVPAYITNSALKIKRAEVEGELSFPDTDVHKDEFVWKRRANGNLGLMWKEMLK